MKIRFLGTGYGDCKIKKKTSKDFVNNKKKQQTVLKVTISRSNKAMKSRNKNNLKKKDKN